MSTSAVRVAPSYAPRYDSVASRPGRGGPAASPEATRPSFQVIEGTQAQKAVRVWPILVAALLVLVLALIVPLVINTRMAQTSYAIRDLRVELAEVKAHTSTLEEQLFELQAAPSLQEKAKGLGLVRAAAPGVVSVIDGTVSGGEPAR